MRVLRTIAGGLSLVALLLCVNLILVYQDLLAKPVRLSFAVGAVLGVVYLLLALITALRAKSDHKSLDAIRNVVASLLFLGICVMTYALVNRVFDRSWDLTREGRRDLDDQTVRVLENLTKDVEAVHLYVSTGDRESDLTIRKTRQFLERCQQYSPRLHTAYYDVVDNPMVLDTYEAEMRSSSGMIVLRCGQKQREIPISDKTHRLEERDFTNALINVVRGSQPKVYFLTGHNEHRVTDANPETGCSGLNLWLTSESYSVAEVTFAPGNPNVPADCDILVINSPEKDINILELDAMRQFVERGGRLLFMLDVWRIPEGVTEFLRPWLASQYGIYVGDDIVISKDNASKTYLSPDFGLPLDADSPDIIRGSYAAEHPITHGFAQNVMVPVSRTVRLAPSLPQGVKGEEILFSAPDTWAETNLALLFQKQQVNYDPDEEVGPLPLAAAVTVDTQAERDGRIVVIGNSRFAWNNLIATTPGNINLFLNTMAWLSEDEDLIGMRVTAKEDEPIFLTEAQQRWIAWASILGVVQAVALIGIVVHLLRRKYR